MKKVTAILGMVLISSTVFAASHSILGEYSTPTGIHLPNYTKEDCNSEQGQFDEQSSFCTFSTENTISIKEGSKNKKLVIISVIYGAGNMREFSGVVTKENRGVLWVKEANIGDSGRVDSLVKGGCNIKVSIENNLASLKLGKNCDLNLERASGAKKM